MSEFLQGSHPKITVMFNAQTTDEAIDIVKKSICQGAEAFCFLTESLLPKYKTKENIRKVIAAMDGRQYM